MLTARDELAGLTPTEKLENVHALKGKVVPG